MYKRQAGGTAELRAGSTLINTGDTFALDGTTGDILFNGRIVGGSITQAAGGSLLIDNGTFDGATLLGDLNLTNSGDRLTLINGGGFTGAANLTGSSTDLAIASDTTLDNTVNLWS